MTASQRHRTGLLDQPGVAVGSLEDTNEFDRVELTNLWTFERRDGVTDTFGAEFSVSQAEYEYARSATYDPAVAAAFGRPTSNDLVFEVRPKVFTYALHAAERRQWKSFEAELGLRFDGEHYNLGGDHTQLSPRLNLRYDVNDRLRVYTSIGRFSQAQHVEEWRIEEAQATADSAQVSIHTILGVTFEPSSATRWGVEAYSKRWTSIAPYLDSQLDPLSLTPDLQPDRIRIAPDESEAAGLELSTRHEFSDRLTAWGTLSWARVADDIADIDIGAQLGPVAGADGRAFLAGFAPQPVRTRRMASRLAAHAVEFRGAAVHRRGESHRHWQTQLRPLGRFLLGGFARRLCLAASHTAIFPSCSKSPTRPIAATNVARCSKLAKAELSTPKWITGCRPS